MASVELGCPLANIAVQDLTAVAAERCLKAESLSSTVTPNSTALLSGGRSLPAMFGEAFIRLLSWERRGARTGLRGPLDPIG